jgi:hypothetical protein
MSWQRIVGTDRRDHDRRLFHLSEATARRERSLSTPRPLSLLRWIQRCRNRGPCFGGLAQYSRIPFRIISGATRWLRGCAQQTAVARGVAMEPKGGIEPRPAGYKSAALPLSYFGANEAETGIPPSSGQARLCVFRLKDCEVQAAVDYPNQFSSQLRFPLRKRQQIVVL